MAADSLDGFLIVVYFGTLAVSREIALGAAGLFLQHTFRPLLA
jgi:hypothetical protein